MTIALDTNYLRDEYFYPIYWGKNQANAAVYNICEYWHFIEFTYKEDGTYDNASD